MRKERISNKEIFDKKESGYSYKDLMKETGLSLSTLQNIVIRMTIEKLRARVVELERSIEECERSTN